MKYTPYRKVIKDYKKILIVGYGFVGKAVGNALEKHHQLIKIDPIHFPDVSIEDHLDADCAILSLPTPTVDGKCDDSIIREVVNQLITGNPNIKILLKSTIPPHQLEKLPENVTYNPEFLRANHAKEDFLNQKTFIIGGKDFDYWCSIFKFMTDVKFQKTDRTTASMVKYMHNTWLAMKVAYFHEVYDLIGDKYNHEQLIEILGQFENVGPSHMSVPNADGSLGFGGHCFPKDTEAFLEYTNSEILQATIEKNKQLLSKMLDI